MLDGYPWRTKERIAVEEYVQVNRAFWDERVPAHAASRDYAVARFAEDPGFLSEVVRFDVARLETSPGWPASTCSATSARTPCRCSASART